MGFCDYYDVTLLYPIKIYFCSYTNEPVVIYDITGCFWKIDSYMNQLQALHDFYNPVLIEAFTVKKRANKIRGQYKIKILSPETYVRFKEAEEYQMQYTLSSFIEAVQHIDKFYKFYYGDDLF